MRRFTLLNALPKPILVAGLFSLLSCAGAPAAPLHVEITDPATGDAVEWRPIVRGTVSEANAEIWVVIHPQGVSGFWVQPPVTVDGDSWSVQVYVGHKEGLDRGKTFEIRAYANPREELHEGERDSWPTAEAVTKVVEVTRQ